jgi:hypothetical protein
MKSLFFATLLSLASSVAIAGCALSPEDDEISRTGSDESGTGSVRLDLQGTASNGTVYRLSNATFTINTTPPTIVSSDGANAAATTIVQQLPAGSYNITLEPGWVLDRMNGATSTAVVATLANSAVQMFSIQEARTTSVTYQFRTSGVVITTGTLNVGIGVTEVEAGIGEACTPFSTPSCAAPAWCGPGFNGSSQAVCQNGGNVPLGGPCSVVVAGLCEANLLCVTSPETMSDVCKQACSPSVPGSCATGTCTPVAGSMQFGTCP